MSPSPLMPLDGGSLLHDVITDSPGGLSPLIRVQLGLDGGPQTLGPWPLVDRSNAGRMTCPPLRWAPR